MVTVKSLVKSERMSVLGLVFRLVSYLIPVCWAKLCWFSLKWKKPWFELATEGKSIGHH